MAQTPSHNNPGFYEAPFTETTPGTYDPATGFIGGQKTTNVIRTYADDGTLAYTQTVNPDGSRGEPVYSPAYSKPGQDIPSPTGPLFRRDTGEVIDPSNPKITHYTPQQAGSDIAAGKTDVVDQLLAAKAATEKANLVGIVTGQQAPGFNNDDINKQIRNTLEPNAGKQDAGSGSGAGGTSTAAGNLAAFNPFTPPSPRTSPTVSAPSIVTPPTVSAPTAAAAPPSIDFNAGLVTPGRIDPASVPKVTGTGPVVSAPTLGAGPTISAGSAGAGSIRGSTQMIEQSRADPVADVTAGGAGRDAQMDALGKLKDAAEGKVPSAAEWLLRKGIDENVGAAYGLAASLQGRNPGLALRTGAITAKDAIAKSSADMAALRAKEQETARGAYAALGTSIADQDLKALMSNQSKDLQLSVTNLNAKIEVQKANQQTQLEEGKADLAAATATTIANLQAQTTVAVANLQASTARDIANQTAQLDASKANAANEVALRIQDSVNQVSVLRANLEAATSANNTNAITTANKQIAELEAQTKLLQQYQDQLYDAAKTNAANKLSADQANATNKLSADSTNATLAEKTQADNDAQDARLKQLGLESLVAQLNASLAIAKTDAEKEAANQAFTAELYKIGGTIAAAYLKSGG